jgi:hypothetical protein
MYPRTVSTDVDRSRLLAKWHEVKLQYTAVSMLYVPLSIVGVAASKLGPASDVGGFALFQSNCQKATPGTNPSSYQ